MDYKKFEENIYKYILEYNKGREKAIKKVEKVQKILNLTNEEISQIIISFDNLLSKNVYKYYYNKASLIGKSIYTKPDGAPEDNVKTCISKIYKIKPLVKLKSLSENTFATKIKDKDKIINFSLYDDYSIEENYKNLEKRKFVYKELAKRELIPKINDIIMCNNKCDNSKPQRVKKADSGYYIIVYDNPADYRQLNAENINKLSAEDKKKLLANLELFAQKILDNKIISYTEFVGEYFEGGIKWLFFDNNLKIVIIITDSYSMYQFSDKEKATMDKKTLYKKITKKLLNNTERIQGLYVKKYVILRLLQEKQLII
jgi:hypothetical protein